MFNDTEIKAVALFKLGNGIDVITKNPCGFPSYIA